MTTDERKKAKCFYYEHKRVSWDEMPMEVRKNYYPYYFDKEGNDHYPISQVPHEKLQEMIADSKKEREEERKRKEEEEKQWKKKNTKK